MAEFTLDTKVSEALEERPELRELLPAFHPAFAKLNQPVIGKLLPRLVSIGDAAKVAGVDAEALLEVFNLPGAPPHALPPSAPVSEPEPPWLKTSRRRELDLRPMLAAGREPFPTIMDAMRRLAVGEVISLRMPFEPVPLRSLLGKRGWEHHVAWQDGDCVASFWRPPSEDDITAVDPGDRFKDGVLDLRGLEPPQPLRMAMSTIMVRDRLTLLHDREPALLYPRLTERGLTWTVHQEDGHLRIEIQPIDAA
jgi:uncharacterized protein (DUF2249 family)